MLKKVLPYIPITLTAIMIVLLPFAYDESLMNAIQSTKTFWFAGFVIVMVNLQLIWKLFIFKKGWNVKTLDIALLIYFIYTLAHPYVFNYGLAPHIWIETLSLTALYFILRQFPQKQLPVLLLAIMATCLVQAIYGSLQLYGFYPSNHSSFNITGSFFNPGPFAGFVVIGLPMAVGLYLMTKKEGEKEPSVIRHLEQSDIPKYKRFLQFGRSFVAKLSSAKLLNYFAQLVIVSILLVLPASRSRAAWFGGLLSLLWLGWIYRMEVKRHIIKHFILEKYTHFISVKSVVIVILLISIPSFAFAYKYKQASADGRLLIWKVSTKMIADKPIFGHGIDKFEAFYMNYQADYFKNNPDSSETMVADNVSYAYNELLQITVEHGLFGLLLAVTVLWALFFSDTFSGNKPNLQNHNLKSFTTYLGANPTLIAARAGLLSILVFGLFSYPSNIMPIKIVFVLFVAIVSSHQKPIRLLEKGTALYTNKNKVLGYPALFVCLALIHPTGKLINQQYQAHKSWKDATDIYDVGAYTECLEDFEIAYPQLKNNGTFLVQYGKAQELSEEYGRSVEILIRAKRYLNNTILYTCLGNNYKALEKNSEAEQAYQQAWQMIPSRFYPLYLLAKLYDETGQKEKAHQVANEVLGKEIKIESSAIKEIKAEMKNIIEEEASLQNKFEPKGKGQEAQRLSCNRFLPGTFSKKERR